MLPKFCNRKIEQSDFIEDFLNKYFLKLKENNIKCICILGNDDLEMLDVNFDELCNRYDNGYNIDNRKVEVDNIQFIVLSKVLDHPFGSKDRIVIENGQEMPKQLSNTIKVNCGKEIINIGEWKKYRKEKVSHMENVLSNLPKPQNWKKTIYVFHNTP